jgi:hypothetical protein
MQNTKGYAAIVNVTVDNAIEVVRGVLRDEDSALDYTACAQVQDALRSLKMDEEPVGSEKLADVAGVCTKYYLDIEYTVVAESLWDTKVEFEIYKHISHLPCHNKIPVYGVTNGTFEPITDYKDAEPFIRGIVHFNGKSNWTFSSKGYDYSSPVEIKNISTVMCECVAWAERLLTPGT